MSESLSDDFIANLLKQDANKPRRGGARKDPTAERTAANWFKQFHNLNGFVCENENCPDPRTTINACSRSPKYHEADCAGNCEQLFDRGKDVTVEVKGKHMCRYCFLDGWLA